MSVGSDPIECCVRGRFLCVCVTARRRGFRGGLLRRGSEKLLSTCFARLSGIGFAAGGGSARASFSRCAAHFGSCRLFAVGLLRRGSEKLLSTCFARLPGIGFAAGGGSARASFSRCAAHFGSCRLFAARPSSDHGRWPDFVRSAPRQGGGRHCFLSLRFGGRGPCRRFSRSGRLRTKVRIAFDGSKTRCMLRPFRAGPLPSAGPAAEEDGPSLSIRER